MPHWPSRVALVLKAMPLFGPPNIEKLERRSNVRALVGVAKDPSSDSGEWDEPGAWEKAVLALGRLRATTALIDVLDQQQPPGRRRASARVLGELGDPRAVEPLKAALWDEDVSDDALKALTALVPSKVPEYSVEPRIAVLTGRLQRGSKAQPDNEFLMQQGVEAARGLQDIGGPRAGDALLGPLTEQVTAPVERPISLLPNETVLIACMRALASLRESRACEPLATLWGGGISDTKVEHEALKALKRIDAARAERLVREEDAKEQASWLTATGPFRADRDALRRHIANRYVNWDDSPPGHAIYVRCCRCGWESEWLPEQSAVDEQFKAHAAEMEALEATHGDRIEAKAQPKPGAAVKKFYRALDKAREASPRPVTGSTTEGRATTRCPSCGAETPNARRCRHCGSELK